MVCKSLTIQVGGSTTIRLLESSSFSPSLLLHRGRETAFGPARVDEVKDAPRSVAPGKLHGVDAAGAERVAAVECVRPLRRRHRAVYLHPNVIGPLVPHVIARTPHRFDESAHVGSPDALGGRRHEAHVGVKHGRGETRVGRPCYLLPA